MEFIKKIFDRTFWKFIGVGVINTLVGTSVMFLFYNLFGLNYWISTASNYVVGGVVSYFLNKHFTFRSDRGGAATVVKFAVTVAICYLLAYGIAKPVVRQLLSASTVKVQENGAMLVGMGLYVMLNYLGQRFLIFRKQES